LLAREFGAQPLVRNWLQSAVALWNRVLDLDSTSLLARAMRENLQLAGSSGNGSLWCVQLERIFAYLQSHSQQFGNAVQQVKIIQPLHCKSVVAAFDACLYRYQKWQGCPANPHDAAGGCGVFFTYERWLLPGISSQKQAAFVMICCVIIQLKGAPSMCATLLALIWSM
jgi:hypothetical protein